MTTVRIRVEYDAPLIPELDDKIRKVFEDLGADNWASGCDMPEFVENPVRDLAFAWELDARKDESQARAQ